MPRPPAAASRLLAAAVLLWLGTARSAASQQPEDAPRLERWVPNRPVSSLVTSGRTLYAGGGFDWIGPNRGAFASIDRGSGAADAAFRSIAGRVLDVEADGSGGWFVTGEIDQVGDQPCAGLIHLHADGTLDAWDANVDGVVRRLTRYGSTLYVAGDFHHAGGQARRCLAAVDVATAQVLAWNPGAGASFDSSERIDVLVAANDRVYVGGFFSAQVGGVTRKNLTAVDAVSGVATGFAPEPDGSVWDIALEGALVYVGGDFTTIGSAPRSRLAALDAESGAAHPLAVDVSSTVLAVSVAADPPRLYLGGVFTSVAGQPRSRMAAIDLTTGTLMPWAPIVSGGDIGSPEIRRMLVDGDRVHVAGSFDAIDGAVRRNLAAFVTDTGALDAWAPQVVGHGTWVDAIAVQGDRVAIGGQFHIVGGTARAGVAAFDLLTGDLTPWAPRLEATNRLAFARAVLPDGNRVYVGGDFDRVNGVPWLDLVLVDATSGAIDPQFDPALRVNSPFIARLQKSGERLFVCGEIHLPEQPTRRLCALDAGTGAALVDWRANADNWVQDLALSPDGQKLYVAGWFEEIGDFAGEFEEREYLAALAVATGSVLPWSPRPNHHVESLLVVSGAQRIERMHDSEIGSRAALFVGGTFNAIDGVPRLCAGQVSLPSGRPTAFDPRIDGPWADLNAIAAGRDALYLGGRFDTVGGVWHRQLAAVDESGQPLSWDPAPSADVWAIVATDQHVIAAGEFTRLANDVRPYLAWFPLP